MTEDSIFDLDFEEFDKVVAREIIIATNEAEEDEAFLNGEDIPCEGEECKDEDEFDFDADEFEDGVIVSIDELDADEEPVEVIEPEEKIEDIEEFKEEETEEVEEACKVEEEEQIEAETADGPINEKCGKVKECGTKPVREHKSLLSIYESNRSRKKNKLVEALLVDSTVDSIEQSLKDILGAFGIGRAEAVTTIGLILDRMLHADDDEVAAPEFLPDAIGEIVDNDDIHEVVVKAVEDALENPDNPEAPVTMDCELNAIITTSEEEQIPEIIEKNEPADAE